MTTKCFEPITLKEMDKVQLMNRIDRKYWFHSDQLQSLLDTIKNDYYLLQISGNSELPYSSIYYETPNDRMYIDHHNGKLNRYKIRRRSYVESGISFLEIKFKTNKGRTIKKRILSDYGRIEFSQKECEFISAFTAYNPDELHPVLVNYFKRLTLVNKNFNERCTIDIDLGYEYNGLKRSLSNMVIVELKSDGNFKNSPLAMALEERRIKTSGFSKYCFGRSITNPDLKQNSFKSRIRRVEKVIKPELNLFNIN